MSEESVEKAFSRAQIISRAKERKWGGAAWELYLKDASGAMVLSLTYELIEITRARCRASDEFIDNAEVSAFRTLLSQMIMLYKSKSLTAEEFQAVMVKMFALPLEPNSILENRLRGNFKIFSLFAEKERREKEKQKEEMREKEPQSVREALIVGWLLRKEVGRQTTLVWRAGRSMTGRILATRAFTREMTSEEIDEVAKRRRESSKLKRLSDASYRRQVKGKNVPATDGWGRTHCPKK